MVGIESMANTSRAVDQTDGVGHRRCATGRSFELSSPDEYDSSAIARANARAWDVEVANDHWATVPLTDEEFRGAARNGFPVSLTGSRPVPASWFGDLAGRHVLCIACGGGQQTVLLAARGAIVTSLDNSMQQLQRDVDTCAKFGLALTAVEGSMDDMHMLSASAFDLVVLGMGAQFVADTRPVFAHVRRLLSSDGVFIGAFINPVCYVFDWAAQTAGRLEVRHKVPYSDLKSLPEEERVTLFGRDAPLEFGHSLEQIIGGLAAEGLCVNGYLEEFNAREQVGDYFPSYFALRAGRVADA
jgi:SAM-dependent methyltransferase